MELFEQQGHWGTMKRRRRRFNPTGYLLLGGTMLAGLFFMVDNPALQGLKASLRWQDETEQDNCVEKVDSRSMISRGKLSQLIAIATPSPKTQVVDLLKEPYCQLSMQLDSKRQAIDRAAYPLEFDPQVWLVVQYQGNQYIGYEFNFREETTRSR